MLTLEQILDRLRQMADQYAAAGLRSHLLRLAAGGRLLTAVGRTRSVPDLVAHFRVNRAGTKQCYRNAQAAVVSLDGVEYWEGYAFGAETGFGVHHAWVVRAGVVYDRTLEAADRTRTEPAGPRVYFGRRFPTRRVAGQIVGRNGFEPLLNLPHLV
jgi:hypothetical protein